ncbi:ABC transporter ATP-binding protein [Methylobacterium sp. NEAU 140]|uniref:ABC transporter ATP-binding protein n=1 Tax=Methylobacterium sp. NEAU 140 TaxID=3064945 RepID=UPI00273600CB|nr:ABC transporter ATP-binding protein [Methylobacterium sp. NEAU 140]MDP4022584.1 ABC transporter ATP-binding protein [Methylobacterium sp. NEAU 140]
MPHSAHPFIAHTIAHPRLSVRDARLRYGRRQALDGVSLDLAPGEIVAVLGESGCGKSSLLRLVAGLEAPDAGEIRIDGQGVAGAGRMVPAERRGVGLMFQDHALFPHLDLLDNVRFGLHRLPRARGTALGLERLRDVGLADRARAYPRTLSGGEAQRVALARALAPDPKLLLLDEPFSSLDPGTRERVRADTLALLRSGGTTALLVTHDPDEAMGFSDRVVLMHAGRIVQAGTAEDLYRRPASPRAARALGPVIELEGRAGAGRIETALGTLPGAPGGSGPVRVCLRPEAIRTGAPGEGRPARVVGHVLGGAGPRVRLAVEGIDAAILVPVPAGALPAKGATVGLRLDPAGAHVFPAALDRTGP